MQSYYCNAVVWHRCTVVQFMLNFFLETRRWWESQEDGRVVFKYLNSVLFEMYNGFFLHLIPATFHLFFSLKKHVMFRLFSFVSSSTKEKCFDNQPI